MDGFGVRRPDPEPHSVRGENRPHATQRLAFGHDTPSPEASIGQRGPGGQTTSGRANSNQASTAMFTATVPQKIAWNGCLTVL